jgi:small subunit ribosomal protein S1
MANNIKIKKEKVKEKKVSKVDKVSGKKVKKVVTMEDLLASVSEGNYSVKRGDKVKGKITAIKNKAIYVDIGAKSDAIVDGKEFEYIKDYVSDLKLDDEIEVVVRVAESDKGQILVSMKEAAVEYGWKYFEDKIDTDETVTVFAKELNRGGSVVIAPFGFFGFIPGSQIGGKYSGDPEKMTGKKVKVKVLEVDQTKNRLVFSERLVSEPGVVNLEEDTAKSLKIDTAFDAKVVRVEPFGLFVHINVEVGKDKSVSLEGLAHISEISWEKVERLENLYRSGDKIKVKLINKDDSRLQFSVKRLSQDPWSGIEKKYPKDEEFEGEVVKIASYGALVRLEAGIEGLIHVSKLSGGVSFVDGDKVKVYIESIDVSKRKVSLGLVLSKKPVIYK